MICPRGERLPSLMTHVLGHKLTWNYCTVAWNSFGMGKRVKLAPIPISVLLLESQEVQSHCNNCVFHVHMQSQLFVLSKMPQNLLRLERDAWSMAKRLRQATNEYVPPTPTPTPAPWRWSRTPPCSETCFPAFATPETHFPDKRADASAASTRQTYDGQGEENIRGGSMFLSEV